MEEYFNVINALKNSKRLRHWDKPPEDYGPNNPEDSDYNRNGLKDIGDFSKIDFSGQSSFTTEVETEEECQEENKDEVPTDTQHGSCSAEGPSECVQQYLPISLDIACKAYEQYKLNLLLEKMSLEKSYKEAIQKKTKQKQEAYLHDLNSIYAQHEKEVEEYHLTQQERIKNEENVLRQQEEEAQTAVQHCKREYTSQVSRQSSQLLEAMESAQRQEAEQANLLQSLIAQLQMLHTDFVTKRNVMYQLLRELEGSEIDRNTEARFNNTRTQVEDIINSFRQKPLSRVQIDKVYKALQQELTTVGSIIQKLESRKVEKANQEAERIQQENEAKAKAAELEMKRQQQAQREQERIESEQKQEEKYEAALEADKRDKLEDFKQKVDYFLEASEKLSKDQLWELRRKATMANQINKDNHSINRDKLQKLLAEMRERKAEPDVLASFKNSVMSNIVKQVAIQDALGASAYSWLLVELVTFHPDLWDLFLYYLFKLCPPLMPGSQMCREGQINIEKLDQYYSQIGKYSTMYGFVLTRISKKQGSPIRAAAIGWEVLANVLSQPPLSGITGEVLLRFIQSFGFTLQETYRKQFVKLMEFIVKCYLPKIRECTEEGGQNCLILFENFLAEYKPNKLTQNQMIMKYM